MAKNRKLHIVCVVLAVLALVFALGSAYARYVVSNDAEGSLYAKEFYFTSDYLKAGGAVYTLSTDATGETSVTFSVRNFEDEYRVNDHEIAYTITVTGPEGFLLQKQDDKLGADAKEDDVITLSALKAGENYTVTVTSDQTDGKGFVKTLSATFKVIQPEKTAYMHLDVSNPAYVVLTVWTKNLTGVAQISFPAGLIPDETDAVIRAANIDNYEDGVYKEGSFEDGESTGITDSTSFTAAYSSHAYRFFIDEVKTYNVSNFAAVVGGVPAQEKASIE